MSRYMHLAGHSISVYAVSFFFLSIQDLILMVFGGVAKTTIEGTKLRGNIHCLLVCDPGTAKSQLLKQVRNELLR